jgi:arylsulfatase A-like enzyme
MKNGSSHIDHTDNLTDPAHPRARFSESAGKRLNVLLVVSDQERGWELYPSGFIDAHTPARTWLRDNGVSFVRYNTPSPICSTSRGLIYTGVHSMNNGVWENVPIMYASPLSHAVPTLGTLFQDAGYITGYAGKWHLSRMSETPTAAEAVENNKTIRSYGFMETDLEEETDGALSGWQHDARTVERALAFMTRREADDQPWFLAVNLLNPHDVMYYTSGDEMTRSRVSPFPDRSARPPIEDPLYAEDLGYDLFENYGPATFGSRPDAVTEYHLTISEAMGYLDYSDHEAGRDMQNYYWNCTRDSDRHLQTLLDHLRSTGRLEDTIIVLTSDHGELLGVHGMRGKGTFAARESARIPAVIVHPHGRRGAECDALTTHIDLAPTLLGLVGVKQDEVREQLPMLVGRDFSAFVFNPDAAWSREDGVLLHWTAILYQDHRNVRGFDKVRSLDPADRLPLVVELMRTGLQRRGQMRGVYDGRWKFQRYSAPHATSQPATYEELLRTHDVELYDTETDPGETRNLAAEPNQWSAEIERLNAMVNRLIAAEVGVDDGSFVPTFGITF